MTNRTPEEEATLVRDIEAMKRAVRSEKHSGPCAFWTPETGWVRVDPGPAWKRYLRRLRGRDR